MDSLYGKAGARVIVLNYLVLLNPAYYRFVRGNVPINKPNIRADIGLVYWGKVTYFGYMPDPPHLRITPVGREGGASIKAAPAF
jgi:hypothetical protein